MPSPFDPQVIEGLYRELTKECTGQVASYIPELAKASPDRFGISYAGVNGKQQHWGDSEERFTIQSIAKTVNYCIAQKLLGEDNVHKSIGLEPSGHGFNKITLDGDHRPHNPMVNAGGITACYLIQKVCGKDALETIQKTWAAATNGEVPEVDEEVLASEKNTGHRNFAIAHFLMEHGVFEKGTKIHEVTDFYFATCSLQTNTRKLALFAATLANGGTNPVSREEVFAPKVARNCLTLMLSCGMYDYSGTFAFRVGLPAKSGVSGGLILGIPRVGGFGIWSPPLDAFGNPVRALAFCEKLSSEFPLHSCHCDCLLS
ncbi:MAG: glutaminase A [Opitutales bacterium]|nr:glutaminase A [Opitutales bacterium]